MVMATTPSDPTQNPTGLNGSSTPGSDSGSTVSRAEHEAAIAAERRRQAGIERERRKQDQRIADLEARLSSSETVTARDRQSAETLLAGLRPDDPARRALEAVINDSAQWKGWVHSQAENQRQQQQQNAVDAAIADAVKNGVPWEELADLNSPGEIKSAAKEWLREKRISDLEKELKAEREGRGLAIQETRTQTRQELGASTPSTATGAPIALRTVDDQITAVQRELSGFMNIMDQTERMAAVHRGRQALSLLQQWRQRGNNAPMPPGWKP